MTRQQTANHIYRRASANNGQPYQQQEEEYDDVWPPRLPSSSLRHDRSTTSRIPAVIVSGNRRYVFHNSPPVVEQVAPRERHRIHWSAILGTGMMLMVVLWVLGNLAVSWWQVTQDDIHYGRPRTFQIDAVVGHNDSVSAPSHFIAVNFNLHIQIIEFPGGDTTKAKIYQGPTLYGDGQNLAVVTLTFKDVNGDGKLDMIINVANTHIIFVNDNGQFRPLKPGEQVTP